jgi:hypothetical protein
MIFSQELGGNLNLANQQLKNRKKKFKELLLMQNSFSSLLEWVVGLDREQHLLLLECLKKLETSLLGSLHTPSVLKVAVGLYRYVACFVVENEVEASSSKFLSVIDCLILNIVLLLLLEGKLLLSS